MLDAETYMFNKVEEALKERFSKIVVYSDEVAVPSKFPCVTFVEYNNYSYRQMQTGDNVEHYVHVSFQVNAYSNLQSAGKKQCKDMMDVVDDVMRSHGFLRRLNSPQENIQRNIHRRVARYSGIVAENGLVYKSSYEVEN